MRENEQPAKKKFDMRVHHMDPKKPGRILKVTHYDMHIGAHGKRFVRDGREFFANGEEVPLMQCQYARQAEKAQAIAAQDATREAAFKAAAEAKAEADAKAKKGGKEPATPVQTAAKETAEESAPAPQADEPAAPKDKPAKKQ